jgi:hypothetical protein
MPRKEFEAFTRLDASDVNTYLMDQSVMTFAGTAARGSAITTPVEGMVTYLEDSQSLSVNNGTDWTIDRTIQVFADSTARGSAIGTAVEGMYAHLNDTDTLTYFDGSNWVSSDPGLVSIIPGAVTVSSGTGSVSADGTINFTDVSSFTLDNIFTTSYRNYRAVMSFTSSASTDLRLQWREGGVTGTGNHFWGSIVLNVGNVAGASATTDSSALFFDDTSSTTINSISGDIYSPTDASVRTGFSVTHRRNRNVAMIGGENQVNSSVDGLIISIITGTMSGKLKIYGYR